MAELQYADDIPRTFSLWQRFLFGLVGYVGFFLVSVIGRTLRWTVIGWEHWQACEEAKTPAILVLWHGCILPGLWFWRNRGLVAMTSQNIDGEYIARIMCRLGIEAARGSSSRGGLKALRDLADYLNRGRNVAITVDGPRGPRNVAKIGPVLLAQRTARPILCFHVSLKHQIQLKSWDAFKIPHLFSPALLWLAPPIYVPPNARRAQILATLAEVQRTLDTIKEQGDRIWKKKEQPTGP
ncbi:MAG: lysophospholipid acyltransferase family protein [Acidobacteria bacterium]|nr:lysophospholipid acyltransferase family protein [Acidobacteriota bacterium]MBI3654939.1 lysophospholipid acyltransferase family protein [Acidobacteriota bacterium]